MGIPVIRRSREWYGEPFTADPDCWTWKGNKIAAMQEARP
jgi:hypothetical protein